VCEQSGKSVASGVPVGTQLVERRQIALRVLISLPSTPVMDFLCLRRHVTGKFLHEILEPGHGQIALLMFSMASNPNRR
jgi:hypothetical protein